jgi:GWxTD domain-containing protein
MKDLCFLIFLLSSFAINAQSDFQSEDLKYKYDLNSNVTIDLEHFYNESGELNILAQIVLRSGIYTLEDYSIYYVMDNSYSNSIEQFTKVDTAQHLLKQVRFNYFFHLKLSNPANQKYFFLFVVNQKTGERFAADIDIYPGNRSANPGIFIWDPDLEFKHPRNYLTSRDSLPILSLNNSEDLYGYFYSFNFDPAEPPFTERSGEGRSMSIDSTFSIKSGEYIDLNSEGMYLMQADTNSMKGLSFIFSKSPYPKAGSLDDLIESMVYFSSRSEYLEVINASDRKAAFDRFWLKMLKTRNKARNMIKFYYSRVEEANKLFTSFKEGWKTDKGMVYIIKGPPDIVNRKENEETWLYTKSDDVPRMKFQFIKVQNICDPNHWVHLRDRSYTDDWFRSIEYLRKSQ